MPELSEVVAVPVVSEVSTVEKFGVFPREGKRGNDRTKCAKTGKTLQHSRFPGDHSAEY